MNTDGPITFTGLIKFLQYIKGPDHWHYVGETGEPAFANSWVNYSALRTRFIKDASGVVHIEGLVKDGTVGSTNTVFTLPVGYRPTNGNLLFATDSNSAFGRLSVLTDGRLVPYAGNNTFFSVNCSFWVG